MVQGTVNPDEYLVFKPLLDRKRFKPIIGKSLGEKEKKMIYAKGGTHPTKNIDTTKEERHSFVLEDDEVLILGRRRAIIRISPPFWSGGDRFHLPEPR